MRKKIVAGNWKMNLTIDEGVKITREIADYLKNADKKLPGVILCTPYTHIQAVSSSLCDSLAETGAQNCSSELSGAFTGEISVRMVTSAGASWVIVGHSERRSLFGETNNILAKKTDLALNHGLKVIYCVGEVLGERDKEEHFNVVRNQIKEGLVNVSPTQMSSVVIAYEPVWAIGTGRTATPEQAQEMHRYIREILATLYSESIANDTTILYGGSCKPSNAAELFSMTDVDGGLIGGASLNSDDFTSIISSFKS